MFELSSMWKELALFFLVVAIVAIFIIWFGQKKVRETREFVEKQTKADFELNQALVVQKQQEEAVEQANEFEDVYEEVLRWCDDNRTGMIAGQSRKLLDVSFLAHAFSEFEDETIHALFDRLIRDREVVRDSTDAQWVLSPSSSRIGSETSLVSQQKFNRKEISVEDQGQQSLFDESDHKGSMT